MKSFDAIKDLIEFIASITTIVVLVKSCLEKIIDKIARIIADIVIKYLKNNQNKK
ncbi:MAG: hypothetical protein IJY81_06125 [Lachnospiraceae bacterium]|nr:hypothetical protein [Lachnospiraceae bacterium]